MKKPRGFIQKDECPNCFRLLDCASVIGGKKPVRPKVGDFSLCIGCGSLLRFDERFILRQTDEKDFQDLSPENQRVIAVAKTAIKEIHS